MNTWVTDSLCALPSVPLIQNLNIVSLNKLMGQNAPKLFVPS